VNSGSSPGDPLVLRGSCAPSKGAIAAPLPAEANSVYSGTWVLGRSAVVYRAEQEEAGVFELFVHELLTQRAGFVRRR
jgi:hypothetical protein